MEAEVLKDGMDALDALLCIGYKIVKELPSNSSIITGHEYRLCSANACVSFAYSSGLLMKEVSTAEEYYKLRLVQEGRKEVK